MREPTNSICALGRRNFDDVKGAGVHLRFWQPERLSGVPDLPDILARTGAALKLIPCLLVGLFKTTGNASPMVQHAGIPAKLVYENFEMRRFITARARGSA